jgi:hypothetical protein
MELLMAEMKADEMVQWMVESMVYGMVGWWVDQSGPQRAEQKVAKTAGEMAALSVEWMVGYSVAWWVVKRVETKDGGTVVDWVVRKVVLMVGRMAAKMVVMMDRELVAMKDDL